MILGLTGGIGSGKSTVAEIFKHLGVPVYEADAASKELIDANREIQGKLISLLGNQVVYEGKVNRAYMASRIFEDESLLLKVNSIIHPAVAEHFLSWRKKQANSWVIKETAILFESGSYIQCDLIIVVSAPQEMRIERVMKRSNLSREEVLARINRQWDEKSKLARADYVITNDLTDPLIPQVLKIYEDIERRADKRS